MTRDEKYQAAQQRLGYLMDEFKVGGNYTPLVRDGNHLYISGQIPRVGDTIVLPGKVGENLTLAQAQIAAGISALRCLGLLKQALGSLDAIKAIPRITVYVRSAEDFDQQSEVANGASDLLHEILREAGVHTRTSVGVMQLPKSAAVEIDMIAVAHG
ncbi:MULTISPECIES: RidA family protein [Pseudomonas fluorescens group]|uniref:YjgF_endoribonc domain-containing protein n=2 Tax=Pseudomonas fluorescens TaxID=294 RepID=C3KCG3_PSEFS|nr:MULTISPECIES: RidA family protein [Pseudomonas fluorescens group]MBZ6457150.1 RidA family protein [Pseudomonas fluorescens group sp.]MBZ6460463.1 RidA family protein [Pseudomonas fluorescens group sp.]MBZ6466105.1 RidA family protein [Pseudomonas fluorescens group sp.]WPN20976.1 RidA family protein [Pseudomonas marginalis]WQD69819.1 RidA family protein [Pseudomonas marginalis]